jgi:hypothetical protein|tara:strand:- start:307 stop:690 length:384 start_codon:yes stop_codon:yes gene_type:complete
MAYRENLLLFAKSGTMGDGALDAQVFPASSFVSMQASAATTTTLYFKDIGGDYNTGGNAGKVNVVILTHANISADANIHSKIAKAVTRIVANPGTGKLLTVVDTANGIVADEFGGLTVTCTTITNTQ